MKILVIGNADSSYIKSFLDEIAESDYQITLLNQGGALPGQEISRFYRQRHIEMIGPVKAGKIPVGIMEYVDYIRKAGRFDICHIQYLTAEVCLAAALCADQFQTIIANYWGSDLLRASAKSLEAQRFLLDSADCILADADVIINRLDMVYNSQYHNIIRNVRFKSMTTEQLVHYSGTKPCHSKKKIIVVCGYNGNPAQQHILMIDAISKCDIAIQKRLKVIIPMTYGGNEKYLKEIEKKLEAQEFESEIIREYITDEENVKLRVNTDIFIHMQVSDAFSSSMLENLLCNTIVIHGKWLEYPELERYHLKCYEAGDGGELTSWLEDMVLYPASYQQEVSNNRQAAIQYWEDEMKTRWQKIYDECMAESVRGKQSDNREKILEYCLSYTEYQSKRRIADEVCGNLFGRKKHNLLSFFEKNKIHKAAVYGMGKWGQLFCQALMKEMKEKEYDLQLFYYDKRKLNRLGIERIELENLKEVDKVIITPIHDYSAIIQELKGYIEMERCMGLSDFEGA